LAAQRLARQRDAQYTEVLQRSERLGKMAKVADTLALEKALMGKGARRKVLGVEEGGAEVGGAGPSVD
jgi:hypothetical protein